ncbi:MAG: FmdB family zinc ribbon protein [Desulfobacterales bacterium]
MPIYEFYCEDCNTIFQFYSRVVNTTKRPTCPKCAKRVLSRRMSTFAVTGRARGEDEDSDLPIDEQRVEAAMQALASEAENLNEDDPRQAAQLMRKLTDATGLELNPRMQEALERMERGEDPEAVEAEMGDAFEEEEPFVLPGKKGKKVRAARPAPLRDETLYDL